jgi:carboxypeptidase Q
MMRDVAYMLCLVTSLGYISTARLPDHLHNQIEANRENITRILDHVRRGDGRNQTFNRLAVLGDLYGSRVSGSDSLENAIEYISQNASAEDLEHVHLEPVLVPKWTRGREFGVLHTAHYHRSMSIMALGMSHGTNGTNVTAPVLVVRSFDELNRNCSEAQGRIVVFNQPWTNYGGSVPYREFGASYAAKCGAIAALVRSVTSRSIYSPHTGVQVYNATISNNGSEIPVASVTVEDAELMQRFQERGWDLQVTINMEAQVHPWVNSSNMVAEIVGSQFPNETVIFGGHIDTWDVTDGSMDDGGGVMLAWEAISIMKRLNLRPKRTIRLVLWTSEEFGLYGGAEYFRAHKEEANWTSLVMEADKGTFRPNGIDFSGSGLARTIMEEILGVASELQATAVNNGGGDSSDTWEWVKAGVPGVELYSENQNYFDYHHSSGDAMTMLNADDLDKCTALWAIVAYTVANLDELLPRTGDYIPSITTEQPPPTIQGAVPFTGSVPFTLLAAFVPCILHKLLS